MAKKTKTTLVVLAAGMGSRFGGLKQMEPFGPEGQTIIDYSVYDAREAGFDRAVIIIKKSIEKDFREGPGRRIEKMMEVRYAYQESDALPAGFSPPPGRLKPYGTAHAVLCTRELVDTPFCVVNSDDFYGKQSYRLVHDFLVSEEEACIAGYRLGNTLTEHGTVNRGICSVAGGYLTGVDERLHISRDSGIPLDALVSMNMWGLRPELFVHLEQGMIRYLRHMTTPEKDEFYLPIFIDEMIRAGKLRVRMLESDARWYGVTYQEDTPALKQAIAEMTAMGWYHF
ncbi:MAG: NTP transferase domain-containing protein [Eubacteriales bacterium]